VAADLLLALALVLIIEGLLPGLNPTLWRNMVKQMAELDDQKIRLIGIGSMIAGAVLFNLVQ
jgi:uncharacterized protein YjeT (DUF2065 family)